MVFGHCVSLCLILINASRIVRCAQSDCIATLSVITVDDITLNSIGIRGFTVLLSELKAQLLELYSLRGAFSCLI